MQNFAVYNSCLKYSFKSHKRMAQNEQISVLVLINTSSLLIAHEPRQVEALCEITFIFQ